eukprot:CAMPEP_0113655144 /NCGR_PEP_ID=MMETSP0017_2-20120614/29537_1 /TAXON_ID=2856 /ORGANISM="Cylindrotheca closterium" /LENGTH=113 /DNA_ID=CAMNT_0000568347 /DNA_START=67 /DNA_END=408 /DNA_ORIENTATION=- /assembly_acc=CAM_ASM_000147
MRNFPAQQCISNNHTKNNKWSQKDSKDASNDKPDWMKRLQEKKKEAHHQTPNIDFELFPSMNDSVGEITYLDDEDDLAASYFPGCAKMGSSMNTIDADDLPPVSGYHFDEIIG